MARNGLLRSLLPSSLMVDPLATCRSAATAALAAVHVSHSPLLSSPALSEHTYATSAPPRFSEPDASGSAEADDTPASFGSPPSDFPSAKPFPTTSSSSSTESWRSEPWVYSFTELPPDTTAARLSDESKESMWLLHRKDPAQWTVARLAKEYRIRQQRVHAILWLKDLEKRAEEEKGGPLDDEVSKGFEELGGAYPRAVGERHVRVHPSEAVDALPLDSAERRTALLAESAREERWKVEEFVKRMEFNRKQMPGGPVKVNAMERRRPADGWAYLVEEIGNKARRGRDGGYRYVVEPGARRRGLTALEKEFLERETTRRRRRLIP